MGFRACTKACDKKPLKRSWKLKDKIRREIEGNTSTTTYFSVTKGAFSAEALVMAHLTAPLKVATR